MEIALGKDWSVNFVRRTFIKFLFGLGLQLKFSRCTYMLYQKIVRYATNGILPKYSYFIGLWI